MGIALGLLRFVLAFAGSIRWMCWRAWCFALGSTLPRKKICTSAKKFAIVQTRWGLTLAPTPQPLTPNTYMTNTEIEVIGGMDAAELRRGAQDLQHACFNVARTSGWWTDLKTGEALNTKIDQAPKVNIPEKLMLIVSEVAEAMEGHRKNLQDDKLPHRKMLEVELADTVIRIFDLAGGLSLDLSGAIVEKLQYNAKREDHKIANRQGENGKKF